MSDHSLAGSTPAHDEHHPDERTYVKIAIILAAITLAEVAIYYIDWVRDNHLLVPMLIVMSIIKFITVIAFYMHLKFDNPLFRTIFAGGLLLSLAVISAVVALLRTHPIDFGALGFIS